MIKKQPISDLMILGSDIVPLKKLVCALALLLEYLSKKSLTKTGDEIDGRKMKEWLKYLCGSFSLQSPTLHFALSFISCSSACKY